MFKFIKKHKLNFISYFLCAFAMALFTIISFSCKTYAYTIDTNGNLVGDNLWSYQDTMTNTNVGITGTLNGSILDLNGTNTGTGGWLFQHSIPLNIPSGTYTLKYYGISSNYGFALNLYDSNNNNIVDVGYVTELTFTINTAITSCSIWITGNGFTYDNQKIKIMINEGTTSQEWEPYGVWYSQNNYNAVIEDNEDLQEQINFRDTSSLLSGIKTTLDNTNLKIYNASNLSLNQMLGSTPFHIESISFPNEDYNYNMEYCNIDTYNAIMNNNGEFSNGDTLTNQPTLLYTFKTPLFVSALTFSRNDTSGTRYIDIYFTDNTSTELLLTEGSENNRLDITWVNTDNKYIQYISTTAEIGFNCVYAFTIPNSNQIYTSGYANGYTDGMYEQYQNDASSIQNANQAKQAMYSQGYAKGIEDASKSHDLGWSSLFFAMADTPFKVVSNVLGFELFGLNLFSTFIGMITVFGVVYLLKKFI